MFRMRRRFLFRLPLWLLVAAALSYAYLVSFKICWQLKNYCAEPVTYRLKQEYQRKMESRHSVRSRLHIKIEPPQGRD
jgi:hypothetical protein